MGSTIFVSPRAHSFIQPDLVGFAHLQANGSDDPRSIIEYGHNERYPHARTRCWRFPLVGWAAHSLTHSLTHSITVSPSGGLIRYLRITFKTEIPLLCNGNGNDECEHDKKKRKSTA